MHDQIAVLLYLVYALLGLAIVIAVLGVVNTLALSVVERTREIGLLRAIGLGRRQLRRMIRLESVVIAVFGAVLGLGLGLVWGVCIQQVLALEGLTAFAVPWGTVVAVVVGSAVVGIAARAAAGSAGVPDERAGGHRPRVSAPARRPGPHRGIPGSRPERRAGIGPMSELRTRAAGPEDLDDVLAFWKSAAEGTSISDDREGVERLVARDPEALILAEREGELVGTVIAGFDGWRCHLYRLAVRPDRRRQGIATALLTAAEDRFVRFGGRRADAMVLQRNATAHHAWDAAGYAPEERWRRWVKPLTG